MIEKIPNNSGIYADGVLSEELLLGGEKFGTGIVSLRFRPSYIALINVWGKERKETTIIRKRMRKHDIKIRIDLIGMLKCTIEIVAFWFESLKKNKHDIIMIFAIPGAILMTNNELLSNLKNN